MLEATLRETAGEALEQPARTWLRQLKRLRRAAAPVRDLDVHRKLLEDWIGTEQPAPEEEKLTEWLKDERKRLAHSARKQIKKDQRGLAERQTAFLAASVRRSQLRSARPAESIALEAFVRAADEMPVLDAENLHDFRKATKKARYLAESGAQGEVTAALKRIQDAIGEWHDWLCLLEEAKSALKGDGPALTRAFEQEVERHFVAALKTTHTMRARLIGEWMASRGELQTPVASTSRRLASAS
jgi:CHAD domain-containing protein